MTTSILSVRLSNDLKNQLDLLSKSCDRPNSYLATKAIQEYINRNAWKIKTLQEAKQEADKGIFISQAAMEDWVNSLGSENELPSPTPDIIL